MSPGASGFWQSAAESPDRIAIIDVDGTPITAGDMLRQVHKISNAMVAEGVTPQSDVAILTRNSAEMLVLERACAQIGAYHTMINTHLAAAEVAYILSDSKPSWVFVDGRTASLATHAAEIAGVDTRRLVCIDAGHGLTTVDEWSAAASSEAPERRAAGPFMLYTSGTSGKPKGVRPPWSGHSPDEYAIARTGMLRRYGIDPSAEVGNGVHLVTSPLYHAAPLANASIALDLAHTVVIMDRFDAESTLRLIDEHRVTWTHVVPTMMRRLMELPIETRTKYDTSSLRWFIHAAAPCPVELKQQVIEWLGMVVWEYYASTEAGGTVIGAEDWLEHPGSVGRAWEGADIQIHDPDGNVLPANEIGDIYILNSRPFSYHNDPAKTAASMRGDYVTAGDVGHLDDDGYLYIADRRTDLILSGGVNVYPREVEDVLRHHPAVADVAVIGVPHEDLGEVVHAVIEPADSGADRTTLMAELRSWLTDRIGSQKHPRTYDFRDELPRSATGKLLRRVLRDEAQR